jgi:hypothetical protein
MAKPQKNKEHGVLPSKKKEAPEYIQVDGVWYERMEGETVQMELNFDDSTLKKLDELMKKGNFVSRGECLRATIRKQLGV